MASTPSSPYAPLNPVLILTPECLSNVTTFIWVFIIFHSLSSCQTKNTLYFFFCLIKVTQIHCTKNNHEKQSCPVKKIKISCFLIFQKKTIASISE